MPDAPALASIAPARVQPEGGAASHKARLRAGGAPGMTAQAAVAPRASIPREPTRKARARLTRLFMVPT
jgi:hypothetical protein